MSRTNDVLRAACEVLESEVDWCQGQLYLYSEGNSPEIVSACAVGAIEIAAQKVMGISANSPAVSQEEVSVFCNLVQDTCEQVELTLVHSQFTLPYFNDLPTTSKEDVLLCFKRAIND